MCMKKIVSRFTSVAVVRTTKKIVKPPDPLSWWSCGPLLIKVCVNPCSLNSYPISILFGLFERACACALNFLTDLRNFNYESTYDLIKI